ncbi:hypothetical protein EYF80_035999 [Liparis tanakae]|uniref:Uncharacterized protein n=1 Tax=Liparis tanakae TaxID=230148 RepID=A0A4Z2GKJ2_9TELE|nr:hypothetical protein EYF80_035999 [Liparis tanakae]
MRHQSADCECNNTRGSRFGGKRSRPQFLNFGVRAPGAKCQQKQHAFIFCINECAAGSGLLIRGPAEKMERWTVSKCAYEYKRKKWKNSETNIDWLQENRWHSASRHAV